MYSVYKCSKFLREQIRADSILFHLKDSILVVGMLTGYNSGHIEMQYYFVSYGPLECNQRGK